MRPDERKSADEAIRNAAESLGYEVLRLTISNDRHVCLTIDSEKTPITVKDAARANYRVRDALAAAGLTVDNYAVEVESPGTRRPLFTLRHFERFVGERAKLKLRSPGKDGKKLLHAIIAGHDGARIRFTGASGQNFEFGLDDLAEATLDPEEPA